MNSLTIIGNVTHTPESRTISTANGDVAVCSFTVAVNGRKNDEAQFFRVSAWRGLGETCAKYVQKGKKVAVRGEVSARAYTSNNGEARASLEVTAQDVEFLSPRESGQASGQQAEQPTGYQRQATGDFADVSEEDLPF